MKLNTARISDTLYLAHPKSGASVDYARGALVGLASGLMAMGMEWDEIASQIKSQWRNGYRRECLPETWRDIIS